MSRLRVFVGALGAEVNAFSPIPLNRSSFESLWLIKAGALAPGDDIPLIVAPLRRAYALQTAGEIEVVQGLCAGAQPGGPIAHGDYVALRDELLADVAAAGRVDVVILGLHGATAAEGVPHCESDLLRRVREVVGDATVVAALYDPHCHLTQSVLADADVVFAYKEYPHDDIFDVADSLVDAALAVARGALRPTVAAFDCATLGTFKTQRPAMRALVDDIAARVRADPRLVDISIAHGFPWGDHEDVGARVWVTTNDDQDLARGLAAEIGARLIALRAEVQDRGPGLADLAGAVAGAVRPVVVADSADNPGGGAPSDATYVIDALRAAGIAPIAAALIWDPVAVSLCVAAGEGARMPLRVGGKVCGLSGRPLDLDIAVVKIVEDLALPFGGGRWPVGRAVRVDADGLTLILCERRTQCFAAEAFTMFGVDLARMHAVVVKSTGHFETSFRPVAGTILPARGPGVLADTFALLPYRRLQRPVWPLDPTAHGGPLPWTFEARVR